MRMATLDVSMLLHHLVHWVEHVTEQTNALHPQVLTSGAEGRQLRSAALSVVVWLDCALQVLETYVVPTVAASRLLFRSESYSG